MNNIDVSIILVSYNTSELTRNCIKSIYEKTTGVNFDIWVVDNNSADNSCEMIKSEFSNVYLIENKQNLGFGGANNIAISRAQGKYIFLLNTDTLLINNAVKILFDFMESNPNIGACGGNLFNADGSHAMSHFYFQTLKSKLVKTFKLGRFFPCEQKKIKGINIADSVQEVEMISGADLFIRKDVLDTVGAFDEDFFLYYEDSELQYRVKKAGWSIFINPEAEIYHLEGKSTKKRLTSRLYKMYSEVLFYKKCYGQKNLGLFKFICFLSDFYRIFAHPIAIFNTFIKMRKI